MTGWTAIVPVKHWRLGKSRFRLDVPARESLAKAFTLDVLEALHESAAITTVVVVSAEERLQNSFRHLGYELVIDRPGRSLDGLNEAIGLGRLWAAEFRPTAPVVALVADLPALTGDSVTTTLTAAYGSRGAYAPDLYGTGTTAVTAPCPAGLRTSFGPGSAERHSALGLVRMEDLDPTIRHDVDDARDLETASVLGLRRHTAEAAAGLRPSGVRVLGTR